MITIEQMTIEEYIKETAGKIGFDEVKAELCKRKFFKFLKEFWNTVEPRPFVYSKHIEFLCHKAQQIFLDFQNNKPRKLTIINLPPSSSKTLIFSVLYPAWCLAVDPTYKVLCGSLDMDVATELSVKYFIVMQSAKFKRFCLFSKLRPDDQGKEQQRTLLGGMRVATSYKGNAISKHFCSILVDDPINTEKIKIVSERVGGRNKRDRICLIII